MSAPRALLAIDQGTTSTRAMVFDRDGACRGRAQRALPQIFPADGWVEHDPEAIWRAVRDTGRGALAEAGLTAKDIAAIGITNQRETTLLWDRANGRPIHNAIVWQDRRGAALCRRLAEAGHEAMVQARTGLVLDAYFSASKIAWLLDTVDGARAAAARGALAFGTVDCFLLWRLTGGRVHATDATNAARTLLFDIHRQDWDDDLLALFDIPRAILPEVRDSAGVFGAAEAEHFGAPLPIAGIAGDQQAALVGQAGFAPGMIKSTYGTGCFVLLNTGATPVASRNRMLTTVAYRLNGRPVYALEGSIFTAGAAVQWLRDGLGLIADAAEIEALVETVPDCGGVIMVPAFTGLGAPYWDPAARGALLGLTRDSGPGHIAHAALDAVCFQTHDLLAAMTADGAAPAALRVDGGMAVNDGLMQRLADLLGLPVERPAITETTALGAACLAGLGVGLYDSLDDIAGRWRCERRFAPDMTETDRTTHLAAWHDAVRRVRS